MTSRYATSLCRGRIKLSDGDRCKWIEGSIKFTKSDAKESFERNMCKVGHHCQGTQCSDDKAWKCSDLINRNHFINIKPLDIPTNNKPALVEDNCLIEWSCNISKEKLTPYWISKTLIEFQSSRLDIVQYNLIDNIWAENDYAILFPTIEIKKKKITVHCLKGKTEICYNTENKSTFKMVNGVAFQENMMYMDTDSDTINKNFNSYLLVSDAERIDNNLVYSTLQTIYDVDKIEKRIYLIDSYIKTMIYYLYGVNKTPLGSFFGTELQLDYETTDGLIVNPCIDYGKKTPIFPSNHNMTMFPKIALSEDELSNIKFDLNNYLLPSLKKLLDIQRTNNGKNGKSLESDEGSMSAFLSISFYLEKMHLFVSYSSFLLVLFMFIKLAFK
jgi:hypothetical protein